MLWLLSLAGLILLLVAGDFLVKGAVNLSLNVGIPTIIISLTVVAFGTSAPELLIAITAILEHKPGIALGNVVGSNTANVLFVLGIPALMIGFKKAKSDAKGTYLFMFFASLIFIALSFTGGFGIWQGFVLLGLLIYFLKQNFSDAQSHMSLNSGAKSDEDLELEEADPEMPGWKIALFLILGLLGLPVGAQLLVENASNIARNFSISEATIGLTLVAVGTSLPELATTVMSAFRRQTDVAIGNVIGSNIFNLLAIIGVTSLIGSIPVATSFLEVDLWIMLAASVLLFPFAVYKHPMNRVTGLVFTGLYLIYVGFLLT